MDSPFSLSGLLDELEKEFAEDDAQAAAPTASSVASVKRDLLPCASNSLDDLALTGLLEHCEEMNQIQPQSLPTVHAAPQVHVREGRVEDAPRAFRSLNFPRPWAYRDDSKSPAVVSLAQDPNVRFRNYMEDRSKVVDPFPVPGCAGDECWAFFAVYDGHGGREAVDYCESRLHEQVLVEMRKQSSHDDIKQALTTAFQSVDSQLAMYGAWNHGSTATVVLLHRAAGRDLRLHVANVGDSRAVMFGEVGTLRLSRDHKPDDVEEARRIAQEGGRVIDGRVAADLAISRSFGDHRLKSKGVSCVPDVCSRCVARGHALIIASDGLWDVISDSDACDIVESCVKRFVDCGLSQEDVMTRLKESAAQELVDRALALGTQDNILVLVVFV